ncbi:MAG: acyl-CoA dehydrogenase [Hyphomonas sp.]|nr:acyl-CoA dehydrogenase [Hyphomonas sp.]
MLLQELEFLAFHVHDTKHLLESDVFADLDHDTLLAALEAADSLARRSFEPIAARIDQEEPQLLDGKAVASPALAQPLRDYADLGFLAATFPREWGGLNAPSIINGATMALFGAACTPAAGYLFLTTAAARLILNFGSDAQRATYLPPMLAGRWFGTMCLSEPQAGSSLQHIRTRALPAADGEFQIKGSKMWISGGDHNLSENIVHLVLARIVTDGEPSNALSLFIVPRHRPDGHGNDVIVTGLNKKLGHKATTNCALSFGENGACKGYLLGEPHQGLQHMFQMMNEARVGVGTTSAATAYAGYRYALAYAAERRQGRRAGTQTPARLVEHPDIRRMLLEQKAIAEGGLCLSLRGAYLIDQIRIATDNEERLRLQGLLDILTPLIKLWCAERGLEANSLAIQTMGGAGYVRDHPVERLFRDQRLNPIHEGTNGILAIDLLMRKAKQGVGLSPLFEAIEIDTISAKDDEPAITDALLSGMAIVRQCISKVIDGKSDTDRLLVFASPIALMLGDLVASWLWLAQVRALAGRNDPFARGKRAAAAHMVHHVWPKSLALAPAIMAGAAPCLAIEERAL